MSVVHGPINEPPVILERHGYNNPQIDQPGRMNKIKFWIMKETDLWTTLSKR